MPRSVIPTLALVLAVVPAAWAQTPNQPKVAPGPREPDWDVVLKKFYGLSMFGDLLNPVKTTPQATPGLFRKAGPGPVTFRPVIALGTETINRGGWYLPGSDDKSPEKHELWSYKFKNTTEDIEKNTNLPPPLSAESNPSFEPPARPFGLWISNDGFKDGGVFTQPQVVAAINARPDMRKQPYKAMIYPNRDVATGRRIPHSYIIGWEYSTNDDFQDVVCQVDNVDLVE
jgi:hypothetical protein